MPHGVPANVVDAKVIATDPDGIDALVLVVRKELRRVDLVLVAGGERDSGVGRDGRIGLYQGSKVEVRVVEAQVLMAGRVVELERHILGLDGREVEREVDLHQTQIRAAGRDGGRVERDGRGAVHDLCEAIIVLLSCRWYREANE